MNTKLAALALAVIIATGVIAYYSLNQPPQPEAPASTPVPTKPPVPSTPTDENTTVTAWDQVNTIYPNQLTIITPENMTRQKGDLTLQVNVTSDYWMINGVYYKADWLGDNYYQLYYYVKQSDCTSQQFLAITLTANFAGIPVGNHTIMVVANYHDDSHTYGTVNFSVGT
jgi:hypothetical protein